MIAVILYVCSSTELCTIKGSYYDSITRLFASVVDFVLHLGPLRVFPSPITPVLLYCRSERDIANIQRTAQTGQSAPHKYLLSLVALIHGPPLSAPLIFS